MSAYMGWRPTAGKTDAERDVVCMITQNGGTNPLEGGCVRGGNDQEDVEVPGQRGRIEGKDERRKLKRRKLAKQRHIDDQEMI
jgi:hypothetical protein